MDKIQIVDLALTTGMRCGLDGATASCRWTGFSSQPLGDDVLQRFRRNTAELCLSQAFTGLEGLRWPAGLLVDDRHADSLASWGVALTILFQRLARDPVGPGRVMAIDEAGAHVAISWEREHVFRNAMQVALKHVLLWLQPPQNVQAQVNQLKINMQQWLETAQTGALSPNSFRFALAARQRAIPVQVSHGVLRFGWGIQADSMDSSFTGRTSNLATRLARNKAATNRVLRDGGVPVPACSVVPDYETALGFAQRIGWPVVVKPSNQDQGRGVTPGIHDGAALQRAFDIAAGFSPGAVIVEKHVPGNDHRMLVVGGRLIMSIRRVPGRVTGNGQDSIERLVDEVNRDPRRGTNKRSLLMALSLDEEALGCLAEQGLTPQSIPETGRFVTLRRTANISTGGTAIDVTEQVHPDNRLVVERAARLIGLDIAGIDFLCPDLSRSWKEVGGAVCEVNAQPGFRAHWLGNPARDINGEIIDWLFRDKSPRIPTAAISGTNGKSTTALMLHRIWMQTGRYAGVCTTQGVWIGNDRITDKNLSGYPGARMILNDPMVEAGIFEMPRKGLLKFGHPCDEYDVAAVLNVQDDHIGVDGVASLDDMAELKAEVLVRARRAAVINADDERCLALLARTRAGRHILVARSNDNPALREHLEKGNSAVFIADCRGEKWIVFAEGLEQTPVVPLGDIPATLGGKLTHNESNALFAAALAWAQGIAASSIAEGLRSFTNSVEDNPGRYNRIAGFPFEILLDFAHNPAGVEALCELVKSWPISGKRRLVSTQIGNRHRHHIDSVVPSLAQVFDEVCLCCDPQYVLQSPDWQGENPVASWLTDARKAMLEAGMDSTQHVVETSPDRAICDALNATEPGDLLVILADPGVALPLLARVGSQNSLDFSLGSNPTQ